MSTEEFLRFQMDMALSQMRSSKHAINSALLRYAEENDLEIVTITASSVEPQDIFVPLPTATDPLTVGGTTFPRLTLDPSFLS